MSSTAITSTLNLIETFTTAHDFKHGSTMVIEGKAPFVFGSINFDTIGELQEKVDASCRKNRFPQSYAESFFTDKVASYNFRKEEHCQEFMSAVGVPYAQRGPAVLQGAHKDVFWHAALKKYIESAKIEGSVVRNTPLIFRSSIVNYNFASMNALSTIAAFVQDGRVDQRASVLAQMTVR